MRHMLSESKGHFSSQITTTSSYFQQKQMEDGNSQVQWNALTFGKVQKVNRFTHSSEAAQKSITRKQIKVDFDKGQVLFSSIIFNERL